MSIKTGKTLKIKTYDVTQSQLQAQAHMHNNKEFQNMYQNHKNIHNPRQKQKKKTSVKELIFDKIVLHT